MTEQTETLLRSENKPEAVEVINFLNELSADEKKEMFVFMQGVRFAKGFDRRTIPEAVQAV